MAGVSKSKNNIISWTHADFTKTDIIDVIDSYHSFVNHKNYKQCVLKGNEKEEIFLTGFLLFQ